MKLEAVVSGMTYFVAMVAPGAITIFALPSFSPWLIPRIKLLFGEEGSGVHGTFPFASDWF